MIHDLLMLSGAAVAFVLSAIIWTLAALHLYWGRGGFWPEENEVALARTVVGAPGIREMPSDTACYTVAFVLFLAGCWPLSAFLGLPPSPLPSELTVLAGYGLAIAFLARGVAAYLPAWRERFPEEPFATNDRRLYGPLCLLIGLAFAFLLSLGWITP
ncbi:MAG: DUF3995 domain-containing protein [Rhodomicrobiaceae bacterium]